MSVFGPIAEGQLFAIARRSASERTDATADDIICHFGFAASVHRLSAWKMRSRAAKMKAFLGGAVIALAVFPAMATAQASPPAAVSKGSDGSFIYAPLDGGGFGWRENSVRKEGTAAKVELFTYYDQPQGDRNYRWLFQTVTFNCTARNYTTEEGSYLTLDGKPVMPVSGRMTWPVEDGTPENIVMQVLCNRANFIDGKRAPNREAAMRALRGG
jgi:hypothetical protein